MRITVYLHVDLLMKAFPAVGTAVRLEAGVGPHMGVQVRCPVKRLVAGRTDVRLYCSVGEAVPSQVPGLPERT